MSARCRAALPTARLATGGTRAGWVGQGLAVHNYWHMALMYIGRGDDAAALAMYDRGGDADRGVAGAWT